jgi:hypothetical protein
MFYRLKAGMDRQQQLMSTVTGNMLMSRPWLRHLPVFSSTFAFLDHNASQLFAYFNQSIQQRVNEREKLGRRDPPQDMVDHFLDQMELSKEDPDQADYFRFAFKNINFLQVQYFSLLFSAWMPSTCSASTCSSLVRRRRRPRSASWSFTCCWTNGPRQNSTRSWTGWKRRERLMRVPLT